VAIPDGMPHFNRGAGSAQSQTPLAENSYVMAAARKESAVPVAVGDLSKDGKQDLSV
jgi:hypothetical protein